MIDLDEKQTYQEIRKYSFIIMGIAILLSIAFFFQSAKEVMIGIAIGTCTGVMGFQMIIKFSEQINGESYNVSRGSYNSYVRRYMMYTIILMLCAYVEIPVLAVLVGFVCHKSAIVYYSFLHRKEDV